MSDHALPIPDSFVEAMARRAAEIVLEKRDRVPVTKATLARRYSVSERTIKTWREKGLPGHPVGREVMFIPEVTDKWISSLPDREGRT